MGLLVYMGVENDGAGLGPWEPLSLLAPVHMLQILALCLRFQRPGGLGCPFISALAPPKGRSLRPVSNQRPLHPTASPMDLKAWGWLASGQGREKELTVARGGGEKRQAGSLGSLGSQCFGGMRKFQRPTSLCDDIRLQASDLSSDNPCASPSIHTVPSHGRCPLFCLVADSFSFIVSLRFIWGKQ